MMRESLRQQGQQALADNERLKQSGEFVIPKTFDRKIRRQIRLHTASRRGRRAGFKWIGAAVCASFVMTLTAFAVLPEWRMHAVHWWMQITDESADFHSIEQPSADVGAEAEPPDGLTVSWVPEGFTLASETVLPNFVTEYRYTAADASYFYVTKITGDGTTFSIDTEDAEIKTVTIQDKDAVFTRKDGECTITWEEAEQGALIRIVAMGIEETELIKIAEGVSL